MNVNPFSYLIEKLKSKVSKSGDTMTGALNITPNAEEIIWCYRNHSDTASKLSEITVGNTKADGTAGASHGGLILMGKSNRYALLQATNIASTNKTIELPNASGTVALTSDIEYHIFRSGSPLSSYSCSISLDSGNRAFIILTRYGIWWGSVIDSGNNVLTQPLYTTTDSVRTINSASYSSGTLTIGFNGAMYGGITIIR
jgi:hypothetical protein